MPAQLFVKKDPTCGGEKTVEKKKEGSHHRDLWVHAYTYYGVGLRSFLTLKESSCSCAHREVFLDLSSRHLLSLLQQSSASVTSFVLGSLCENKALVLLYLTADWRPIYLLPQVHLP